MGIVLDRRGRMLVWAGSLGNRPVRRNADHVRVQSGGFLSVRR
jgi:hypothetical protein